MRHGVDIVIPVKRLDAAKSRLAPLLGAEGRWELVLEMFGTVLSACLESTARRVIVMTPDTYLGRLATDAGASWMRDRATSLNRSLDRAFEVCWGDRAAALYLPSDLPLLAPGEVDALLERATQAGVVIAPSGDGTGTNALLLRADCRLAPSLGDGSFHRHRELAAARGYRIAVHHAPGLAYDVDTPADLLSHPQFSAA